MAHPNKHIRKAIRYAIDHGWREVPCGPRAHCHSRPYAPDGIEIFTVYSTPRDAEDHARDLRRRLDRLIPGDD